MQTEQALYRPPSPLTKLSMFTNLVDASHIPLVSQRWEGEHSKVKMLHGGHRAEWLERELSLAGPAACSLFFLCCACCALSGECGFTLMSNMRPSLTVSQQVTSQVSGERPECPLTSPVHKTEDFVLNLLNWLFPGLVVTLGKPLTENLPCLGGTPPKPFLKII